ncbi:Transcriptional regulator LytR [bacterium HR41]|nr:Transcriptional regulator LytR [bacterium HR41]
MAAAPQPPGPPQYRVYRARRFARTRTAGLGALRQRRKSGTPLRPRGSLTVGRVVRWFVVAAIGWVLLSLVLFLLSAQLEAGPGPETEQALGGGGNLLTGATVLVLGTDERTGASIDRSQTGPPRADSIMLMRASLGGVRKLSIPRDTYAEIPGHPAQKINAAFALGGAPLMIETVENFFGGAVRTDHVVQLDFADFPKLIDALGGITVENKSRICSPPFDNFWRGLNFPKGKVHLDGQRALGFARVRKNRCAPNETDLDRSERQQEVVNAIRRRLLAPTTFFRLPLVAWRAPKALVTDMKGPALLALFADMAVGGSGGNAHVLEPSCLSCGPGSSIIVSEGAKRDALDYLLGR